jgi:hypothetical protein
MVSRSRFIRQHLSPMNTMITNHVDNNIAATYCETIRTQIIKFPMYVSPSGIPIPGFASSSAKQRANVNGNLPAAFRNNYNRHVFCNDSFDDILRSFANPDSASSGVVRALITERQH